MIIDAVGTIFLVFFIIVIVIILIPIFIAIYLYFGLRKNPLTLQQLWRGFKDFFVRLLENFGKTQASNKVVDEKGHKIEDAEFREVE